MLEVSLYGFSALQRIVSVGIYSVKSSTTRMNALV